MRLPSLACLCALGLLASTPAFAQMTQQNRQNQGHAAHPPATTTSSTSSKTEQGANKNMSGGSESSKHSSAK